MKGPIFKKGDKITFKKREDCKGGRYRHGGICQGGVVGEVMYLHSYDDIENQHSLTVSPDNNYPYLMLENEFEEYDKLINKINLFEI